LAEQIERVSAELESEEFTDSSGDVFQQRELPEGEIDEVYVSAGLKARERDQELRSHGLSTRGRGSYDGDKPRVFTLVDRGSDDRYVVPARSADEPTIRLLLAGHEQESLTVYTDGVRAYDPREDDDSFTREYVATAMVNTLMARYTSTAARATVASATRGSRPTGESRKTS
jgi:transposase-like protein